MAETSIEWTDHSWNPIRGCSRVSRGCEHCYAERMAARFAGPGGAYEGLVRKTSGGPRWTGKMMFIEEKLTEPLRRRVPTRYFVNSMSDLFHEGLSDADINRVFGIMMLAERHTFIPLTKRPERARDYLSNPDTPKRIQDAAQDVAGELNWIDPWMGIIGWPLPNVHLGVSVEDQPTADERIPLLRQCPNAVPWISYEPAIAPVVFREEWLAWLCGIIVGGESGPGARPMHPAWARSVRDQCVAAGVPFFFKQIGAWGWGSFPEAPARLARRVMLPTGETCVWAHASVADLARGRDGLGAEATIISYVGKKRAGALLDGREWRQLPEPRS